MYIRIILTFKGQLDGKTRDILEFDGNCRASRDPGVSDRSLFVEIVWPECPMVLGSLDFRIM